MRTVLIIFKDGTRVEGNTNYEVKLKGNFFVISNSEGVRYLNGDEVKEIIVREKEIDINKRL